MVIETSVEGGGDVVAVTVVVSCVMVVVGAG